MAEATGLRNNALPYPIYGCPFGFAFPIMEADGDLVTSAANLDSEISLNGDTLGDCTNEATEIGGGLYYLLLTAAEMTADVITGVTKTSTADAKTTSWSLYPRKLVTVHSGTAAGGDTGYITLDSGAAAVDDYYNGMVVIATIDSAVEARVITDYTGSSKQATVTPAWNTAPDSDDTFVIKLPEGVVMPSVNVTHVAGTVQTAGDVMGVLAHATYGNSALASLLTGKIKRYLMLLFRKDAAIKSDYATELGEINANTGTGAGAYDNATDSGEALRDRGDTAWLTATGFSTLTQQNVADALKLAPTVGDPVAGSVNAHLDAILEDTGTTLDDKLDAVGPGVGAHSLTYTLTDSGTGMPVADVLVELSTDSAKANVIRSGRTDSFGQVTFYLSAAGTYYVWRTKDGFSATDPDTEVVA